MVSGWHQKMLSFSFLWGFFKRIGCNLAPLKLDIFTSLQVLKYLHWKGGEGKETRLNALGYFHFTAGTKIPSPLPPFKLPIVRMIIWMVQRVFISGIPCRYVKRPITFPSLETSYTTSKICAHPTSVCIEMKLSEKSWFFPLS